MSGEEQDKKLVLSINEITSFCFCPMYYKAKKQEKQINIKDKYTIEVLWCICQYMKRRTETGAGGIPFLKRMWGLRWIEQKEMKKILTTASSVKRDSYDSKRVNGYEALLTFYDMINKSSSHCIVAGEKFSVPIFDDDPTILLTGVWDMILEMEDGSIKLIKVIPESNKFEIRTSIRYNIEITLMYYAFQQMFKSFNRKITISVFDLQRKKEWITERNENDIKILKDTVKNMIYCVNHDIMLLSPDKRCYHCDVRHLCENTIYSDSKFKRLRRK